MTSETDGTRLTVVLESGGVSTLDLVWTEWRLTPPAGVDVASVSSLFLDYGDGNAVELDRLLVADGDEVPDSMAVPWRNCPRRVFFLALEAAFAF